MWFVGTVRGFLATEEAETQRNREENPFQRDGSARFRAAMASRGQMPKRTSARLFYFATAKWNTCTIMLHSIVACDLI